MVSEAEKYKAEDEEAAARITAKNGLESYAYNLRNSVDGDLKDKLEASDKESLDKAITETISWLDASAEASKEEYEEKQKELEGVANPSKFFLIFSLCLFPQRLLRYARSWRIPWRSRSRCWRRRTFG